MLPNQKKSIYFPKKADSGDVFYSVANKKSIPDLSAVSILIVEDVPSCYQFLSAALRPSNAKITWVQDGRTAIEYLRDNNAVDLVLMDLKLPIMTGYEATQIIKKEYPHLPVIAQTAYAMQGDREKCLEIGCDDYISKPISIHNLYCALEAQLN